MTKEADDGRVTLDSYDAQALWEAWFGPDDEDILAREAFERTLRGIAGLEDEGLYFRPGGWSIDLAATAARAACAAAILAALFEIAGLHDVERAIIVSTAGLIASMDIKPVRLGRHERRLADNLHQEGLTGVPLSAEQARAALPKDLRRHLDVDQIAGSMDRLVAAGLANKEGDDVWVLRAQGSEAWIRVHVGQHFD